MEYRVTATTGAPPAQVYRLFIDVERWPELTQSMRSVRRLDGGPIRVGSEAMVRQPRLPSSRWRVTEVEPDRRFTWQTSAGGVTTVGDHLVEPDGPGSTITLTLRMSGPLSGVMGLLMGGIARRYAAMELEGFRAAADTAAPPAPPPRVGEPFSAAFGGRPAGRILSVEPGVQLTGVIMGTLMSYVLVPSPDGPDGDGGGTIRLLLKLAAPGRQAVTPLLCVGDLVMARRQLRTLARLAEATPADATPPGHGDRDQGGQR